MGPTLERLKLTVAYDGRRFSGWQSQRNGNAIQDHLERAFSQIASVSIKIQGAGRTDSGVHALGQVAHADVPRRKLTPATWRAAANARLPAEIRVLRCQRVSADFHAQYSAVGKVYRYRIWNAPIFHPLEVARAWHVPHPLDFDVLRVASDRLTGTHDYASFAANRGTAAETTTRTIHQIRIQRRKEHLTLEFHGNGFLYRMVRMLTGTIIRVASRKADLGWIVELLAEPGKSKTNCTAPAGGLYLVKVKYAQPKISNPTSSFRARKRLIATRNRSRAVRWRWSNQSRLNDPGVFDRHTSGALDLRRLRRIRICVHSEARVTEP